MSKQRSAMATYSTAAQRSRSRTGVKTFSTSGDKACPVQPQHKPHFPEVDKLVTGSSAACHDETGKLWLVQTCQVFDETCGKWSESMEGVVELPMTYKASTDGEPVNLPSFNGVIDAFDTEGNPIELVGGMEVPANMSGTIFCINGELCYIRSPLAEDKDTFSVIADNGDGSWAYTNADGSEGVILTGSIVDNGDGTATVSFPDGSTKDVVCAPLVQATVVDNGDGTGTVTDAAGAACIFVKGPLTQAIVADNGDGTGTVTDAEGNACVFQKNQTVIVDNGDGTWDYTNADGTTGTIRNTSGTVVDNGDGTGTVTFPDGTTKDFVCAPLVQATVVDNGDGTGTVTDSEGAACIFVKGPISQAIVADNGDGTGSVTDVDGNECVFQKNQTVIVDNGDGSWAYTNADGAVGVITDTSGTVIDNGDGTGTVTFPDGTTKDFICAPLTQATVVDNGDGTGTVTDAAGESCAFLKEEAVTTLADNGDRTYTYTSEDGTETVVTDSFTAVADNGDDTGTVTDPDGNACTFLKAETVTTLVDNGDSTYTYISEDGTETVITDSAGTVVDNGDNTGTVTFPDGTECTFLKNVEIPGDVRVTGITFQESADGSMHDIILQLSDGSTLNAGPVVDADTFATVVDNADNTGTVTDPAGNACTFLKAETVTTLADNGDGTYTYTSEDGTETVVQSGSVADNGDGTGTVTFPDGTTCDFVKAPLVQASVVDNGDGTGTVTDVDGNVCVFAKGPIEVDDGAVSSLVDNGDGTWTHDDGLGNTTIITDTSGTFADNGDGTYTATNADGSEVTFGPKCPVFEDPLNPGSYLPYETNPDDPTEVIVDPRNADCDGNEIPRDHRYVTYEQQLSQGLRFEVDFIDSGDGCTPSEPSGWVANYPLKTCNPIGEIWHRDAGSTWQIKSCAPMFCRTFNAPRVSGDNNITYNDPLPEGTEITPVYAEIVVDNPSSCPMELLLGWGVQHAEYTFDHRDEVPRMRFTWEYRKSTDGGATFSDWTENGIAHQFFGWNGALSSENEVFLIDTSETWYADEVVPPKSSCIFQSRGVLDTVIGWLPGTRTKIANPYPHVFAVGGTNNKLLA